MLHALRTVLTLGLLAALVPTALALEVVEVRWGFDGTVRAGAFNPLAIRVVNDGRQRFEGVLTLERRSYAGRGGGVHRAPCFLDPGQERWLRFYPLVLSGGEDWVLDLGAGPSAKLAETKAAAPAWVVLVASRERGARGRSTSGLVGFPDELFPPTAAATSGLGALVLDHAPEMLGPQRQALVDWVAMGGVLHLVPDAAGELPTLEGELAPLSGVAESQPHGAGRVLRHPGARWPISRETLEERSGPLATLPEHPSYGQAVPVQAYGALERFTKADHDWSAIYLLALLYFVLVGPGCALVARRFRSHVVANGTTVALVVAFGLVFGEVGRRGYGERESLHAASFARSLGGDRYDVLQYGNLFVTASGRYEVQLDSPFGLYATGIAHEAVDCDLACGPAGALRTVVPLYSSRGYAFRGALAGPALDPVVRVWHTKASGDASVLDALEVRLARPLAEVGTRLDCLCLHRGTFRRMQVDSTETELVMTADAVSVNTNGLYAHHYGYGRDTAKVDTPSHLRTLAHLLIAEAQSGGDNLPHRLDVPELSDDEAELYLVVYAPPSFLPRVADSHRNQTGVAVLAFRLRRPHP